LTHRLLTLPHRHVRSFILIKESREIWVSTRVSPAVCRRRPVRFLQIPVPTARIAETAEIDVGSNFRIYRNSRFREGLQKDVG
jgi:hypothetical protein